MKRNYIIEEQSDMTEGHCMLATRDVFTNKVDAVRRAKAISKERQSTTYVIWTIQWQIPESRQTFLDTVTATFFKGKAV